jgi:hypothetical protein
MAKEKTKLDRKTIFLIILILAIILGDLAIYFFYYAPRTRTSASFYGELVDEEMMVSAFVISLSLKDSPEGELVSVEPDSDVIFEVQSGKQTTVSTLISEGVSDSLQGSPKYLVREFEPAEIEIIVSRPEELKPPKDIFIYKESAFVPDMFALLAGKGYDVVEVVPFYWEGEDRLSHYNRMLVFPDENRELVNTSIHMEYAHLIGEGLIGGPEVERIRVSSLNNDVISFLKENYEKSEALELALSNETFVQRRRDIYKYFVNYAQ